MSMRHSINLWHRRFVVVAAFACLILPLALSADEPALTKDQMEDFLQHAEIVKSKDAAKGVTGTFRLTLSNGTMTHDASFQSVDERKGQKRFSDGRVEFNFVDSYKYNIAAYR